ncbi:hypothetical protein SAMN05421788_108239 [Filimonas lacunae]|uniref:Uncharacterized protein n=1 Tax=Filimonas lacunae TaxID=477680 RepID=A0A173MDN7_9BACT|nr:hypothetical protein [Filimonas lacunae]BAV05616.1 hypothetical protein FLA_1627 [Filimonas lacunae]SIT29185.1 hypothetical protein SAMN05421788_108239 [Filimonas lacunae]
MAKNNTLLKFKGNLGDVTFVESKAYDPHVRSKRGTFKPALLNDAMKASGETLAAGNKPAKMIFDVLAPYRIDFAGGPLWQKLVSLFKKQLSSQGSINLTSLTGFEIHPDYPLRRFMLPVVELNREADQVHVTVRYSVWPNFKKQPYIDGFRLQVIIVFPDMEQYTATSVSEWTDIISLPDKRLITETPIEAGVVHFKYQPGFDKDALVCIKLEGCEKGMGLKPAVNKGMAIVRVGSFLL